MYFDEEREKLKKLLLMGILVIVLLVAVILASARFQRYKVIGNTHYTEDQVLQMVFSDSWDTNSFYQLVREHTKSHKTLPFVEKYELHWLSPLSIEVIVYEKNVVGYVDYMSSHMYFDKDGIVVESSTEKTEGIPLVTGLSFDHVVLYESLPVENSDIFKAILSITQLVNKYNLSVDRIYFGTDDTLTLYFGDVRVALGEATDLDEKLMKLQYILPELEGKSGVLRMESYTEETKNISFEPHS